LQNFGHRRQVLVHVLDEQRPASRRQPVKLRFFEGALPQLPAIVRVVDNEPGLDVGVAGQRCQIVAVDALIEAGQCSRHDAGALLPVVRQETPGIEARRPAHQRSRLSARACSGALPT
jgi:hypothetical protein